MSALIRTAIVCLMLAAASPAAAAELISTEDLVRLKEKWTLLLGSDFRVEVRVKVFGPRLLAVLGTDLQFRAEEPMTRDPKTTRYEAIGTLLKDVSADRIYYLVRELKPLPSDYEVLREKRRKLSADKPNEWYDAATWAEQRGRQFDDAELLRESKELYQKGLETEYSQMTPRDPRGIRDLVAKLDRWKLDQDLRARMVFEAFHVEYEQGLKNPKASFSDLLSRISRDLEGSDVPLTESDAALKTRYEAAPIDTYRTAKPGVRPQLHRMLYVDTFRERILREADPQGRNGREIADRLGQIPELLALARDYREKEVVFRTARVATMPRQEMLEFVKSLSGEMDPRADAVRRSWIASREPRLRKQGVNGLVELGDDSLSLLGDKAAAIKYFLEAERLSPNLGIVTDRLKKLDFVPYEGRWIPKELVPPPTADPFYEAVQSGQIKVGMSPRHVRAALGSAPDEVIRSVSGAGIKEWWTYKGDSISVEFASTRNERGPPKVTKVSSTRRPAAKPDADGAPPAAENPPAKGDF